MKFLSRRPTHGLQLSRIKLGGRPGLLAPAEKATMGEPLCISIRHAITGEILCELAGLEVGELRVWELRLQFCQKQDTLPYFDGYFSIKNEFWMIQLLSRNIGMTLCRQVSSFRRWCGSFAHRHKEKSWPSRRASNCGTKVIYGQS